MKIKNLILVAVVASAALGCIRGRCIDGNGELTSQKRKLSGSFTGLRHESSFNLEVRDNGSDTIVVEAENNLMKLIVTEVKNGVLVVKTPRNRCVRPREKVVVWCNQKKLDNITLEGSGSLTCHSLNASSMNFTLDGSGDMRASSINAQLVNCRLEGSGKMDLDTLKGGEVKMVVSGSGDLENGLTLAQKASLTINGSGSIKAGIDVESLAALVDGSGCVKSRGSSHDAKVKIKSSGSFNGFDFHTKNCQAIVDGSGSIEISVSDKLDASIDGSGDVVFDGNPSVTVDVDGSGKVKRRNN